MNVDCMFSNKEMKMNEKAQHDRESNFVDFKNSDPKMI